ncbi:Ubiquitin carboxyl-terminal hydrolase [Trichinella spiralis]|uniref:Ubiquitin carboxyl-terminal hydrolase n=1 Tax=Trichinella spiralis TaxID=6334 RepID=A0ABR3KLF3_TRISP
MLCSSCCCKVLRAKVVSFKGNFQQWHTFLNQLLTHQYNSWKIPISMKNCRLTLCGTQNQVVLLEKSERKTNSTKIEDCQQLYDAKTIALATG